LSCFRQLSERLSDRTKRSLKLAEVARRVVEEESLLEPKQRQAPAAQNLPAD